MALAAGFFILGNTPHISDEVIYQFQAKALAGGKLYFAPPPEKEFFTFIHSIVDGEKWYGVLNPGWPGILALGYVAHTPWLVNPLLGALTLVILFAFYKEAGYSPPGIEDSGSSIGGITFCIFHVGHVHGTSS